VHTIVHAIAGYFFLLLTVRILSRRPGAQMTPFEFVADLLDRRRDHPGDRGR